MVNVRQGLEQPAKTRGKRDSTSEYGKIVATLCIETPENTSLTT